MPKFVIIFSFLLLSISGIHIHQRVGDSSAKLRFKSYPDFQMKDK